MLCASSRPRTTSASIDECVRKTSFTSSGRELRLADLHDNHGHVVVRLAVADERTHLADHALANPWSVELVVAFDDVREARVGEQLAVGIHGFGNAVGVEHEYIPGLDLPGVFLEHVTEALGRTW